MSNELVSVSERLATKYGTQKTNFFNIVKSTCKMGSATNEQFEAFLLTAEKYGLNPLMKQMWAYPDRSGGIQTMVSIDGWISIVNNQDQFDGFETNTNLDENSNPISSTCKMYRKDRNHPTVKTVFYKEWVSNSSPVWKNMPIHMLENRAFIQCARLCFNITGIQDEFANFHTDIKEEKTKQNIEDLMNDDVVDIED